MRPWIGICVAIAGCAANDPMQQMREDNAKQQQELAQHIEQFKQQNEARHQQFLADEAERRQFAADQIAADSARAQAAKKAEEERLRRPPCCRMGMTEKQVRASQMGEPDEIHRTVTASHVHEQWVYAGRGYLYFDDGKLTAFQD